MLIESGFQQTPLFQLNLLLWLVWPSTYAGITPLFRNEGFELYGVGPEFRLSPSVSRSLREANLSIQAAVRPDLVLKHTENCVCVPIECKVNSFSSNSSNVRQANTLLSLDGRTMANWIGLPSPDTWTASLVYAVEGGRQELMLTTLNELSNRLRSVLEPIPSTSVGIDVQDDGIYLQAASATALSTLNSAPNRRVRIRERAGVVE